MQPLNTAWTKDIKDPEAKKKFEDLIRNSTMVLGKLKAVIEEMENSIHSQNHSVDDFKDPNWSHKQAFRNGEMSRLKKIKDLIPF